MAINLPINIKKPLLIAEIGINHNGSVDSAKKMISLAKKYNFDLVKFQKEVLKSLLQTFKKKS